MRDDAQKTDPWPTVVFAGGPMDGYRMPVHPDLTPEDRAVGVAHICDEGTVYGPGGRACYAPPAGDPMAEVWQYEGDMP